jgi:hypothetical protein
VKQKTLILFPNVMSLTQVRILKNHLIMLMDQRVLAQHRLKFHKNDNFPADKTHSNIFLFANHIIDCLVKC